MKTLLLNQNTGYWDTSNFPIGGCFRRCGKDGLVIKNVEYLSCVVHGCNAKGITNDGRKVAFDTNYCLDISE